MTDEWFFEEGNRLLHRIGVMLGENPFYHSLTVRLDSNSKKEYGAYLRVDKLNDSLMFSSLEKTDLIQQLEDFLNSNDVDYIHKKYHEKQIASIEVTLEHHRKELAK